MFSNVFCKGWMNSGSSLLDFTRAAQGLSGLNCVSLPLAQQGKGNSGDLFYVRTNALAPPLLFLACMIPMGVMFLFGAQCSPQESSTVCSVARPWRVHLCLAVRSVLGLCFLSCRMPDLNQRQEMRFLLSGCMWVQGYSSPFPYLEKLILQSVSSLCLPPFQRFFLHLAFLSPSPSAEAEFM